MQCTGKNCKRRATCVPVTKVPARGLPENIYAPATVVHQMPMCNRCVELCKIEDFFTDEVVARVQREARRKQPVDLSLARMDKMRLNQDQLRNLVNQQGGIHA